MPMGIIDILKLIDIKEHQRVSDTQKIRALVQFRGLRLQCTSIGNSRQRIRLTAIKGGCEATVSILPRSKNLKIMLPTLI